MYPLVCTYLSWLELDIMFVFADERAGLLCCVLNDPDVAVAVRTQLVPLCRRMWSNPPNHGCRIVATALANPSLYQEWSVTAISLL